MSMSSGLPRNIGSPLKLEYPQSLAVYDDYAAAQKAVDFLSDQHFPVEQCMIVGTDLKRIERITGRLTTGRVALGGLVSGVWLGLFVGLIFALFTSEGALVTIISTMLIGALFGVIWALVGYAATRGQRDFSSVTSVVATRYEVLVEHKVAAPGPRAARPAARCHAQPLRLTDRAHHRTFDVAGRRGDAGSVRTPGGRPPRRRHRGRRGRPSAARGGSNPVEAQTASYQCGAQTPSESRGPAGQESIRSVKSMPSQWHSQRRWPSGSRRKSAASMTGGCSPASVSTSRSRSCWSRPMSSGSHSARERR